MNTNNPTFPSFLLSRYHQHLNHLNDMAYTHTKILQEIIEKRSDQSSPPHGSITSSPSSSTSTNDTVKHKRSYPSNDNEHLNKRSRKQAKPQQYVPLDANNPTSSDDDDEDQSTTKQTSLPNLPLPLNNLPLMNYFQDLIRTNGHIIENIFQSRRLPSFLPHPYFLNNPFPPLPGPSPSLPSFPYHFSAPKNVTDTRLSPRITSKMPSDDSTDDENSSDGTPNQSIEYNGFQIILTPVHLRKAKLMFFYTRYPSSSVLKVYFPDVKFDKVITSQLVKWFSNFREFFYQQIEKTARQYLAEGIQNPDDLVVTTNSELYRALNIHYNRSNQINVPISFLTATQCALREFFLAIQQQKDLDSSWKKSIYKIMQRLDDQIPELFKNDHWMHSI